MTKLAEYIGTFVEAVMLDDPKASVTVLAVEYGARLDVRRYTAERKYGADQMVSSAELEQSLLWCEERAKRNAQRACRDIAKLMAEEASNTERAEALLYNPPRAK